MAIYHLTHRTVGRSTHAAGTAGAHIDYITRASACRAVIAQHIPAVRPGSRGGAARAWMDEQEEGDRKNARVIDKLEIALPLELDELERVTLVRRFVRELSGGADVPFFAALHDKAGTKDEANPHAHVVIRDRDPETGKGRVIGMSEKGSTDRAREIWEQVCNEALTQAGSVARIDRRSLKAQGIDRAPQGHQGPQAREIAAKGKPSDKLGRIQSAPGHDPALSAPERRKEAHQAAQRDREARTARRAAEKAAEARRQQEAQKALQRAAQARAEAEAQEQVRLAALGRELIEQDRANVTLFAMHDLSDPFAAAIDAAQPPQASDLDHAAKLARTRPHKGPWIENEMRMGQWRDSLKHTLARAWRWVAGLIARADPAADQAAATWAKIHEDQPAAIGEWRDMVAAEARKAIEAGHRLPEPERPAPRSTIRYDRP